MHSSNSACTQPRLKLTQVASEWLPPSLPEGSTCVHSCCIYVFVFLFLFAFMCFSSSLCICIRAFVFNLLALVFVLVILSKIFVTVYCPFFHRHNTFGINPVYTSLQISICINLFAHDRPLSMNKVYKYQC